MNTHSWSPKPRTNISAPNYVIEEIRDALLNRSMKPGDRLPSELELAALYGVSRGSVRQAMKALEILGIVSIRPGDGTYVNTSISEKSLSRSGSKVDSVEEGTSSSGSGADKLQISSS